ncbi:MAG: 4-hydroxythreonine-4-phosphate dehydrogenase PdxA [Gammaproteobacteria bacterium]|mgnify:FL=1|jgi:4-hydroxythreonine-4-phosphate dehydrogenase|nr:4-hydroxythreonine-4-phosphate dehydrogenase PdxA [Gammaproteobacteria bacterium]|tara:strand:- start:5235 stop:6206 length:972 start_codon:yes stop_codon:yes gene_type:complete
MRMAVTMGDASGIGPEIVLRCYSGKELKDDFVLYGDSSILRKGADLLGLNVDIHPISSPANAKPGRLNIVEFDRLTAKDLTPGQANPKAAAAAMEYVIRATKDALNGEVAGLVTLPMNKEATRTADPSFVGHTELIASICGIKNFSMMLTTPEVAVSHVSTHVSLEKAIRLVEPNRIVNVIELTNEALRKFVKRPRIAVCGLNPHAGESGIFGDEDQTMIIPAVITAKGRNIDVSGPHPADTVFFQAIHNDRYDAIVCMYHDQGHAPMKLFAFQTGVNVTIGLPIIRTSVDHGTAYDIAWQGKAFTQSLGHALQYAWKLTGRT